MRKLNLRDESGVALVVAAGALMVIGILSAVVASGALSVSTSAGKDRSAKRALAAAEAGIQRAIKDMNAATSDPCPIASGPNCGPTSASLGDGVSWQYYISPALDASNANANPALNSNSCIGVTVQGPLKGTTTNRIGVFQRCVTAFGTARGVTRRIQARLAGQTEFQLFPVGITGARRICLAAANNDPEATLGPRPCNPSVMGGGGGTTIVLSDVAASERLAARNVPVCGDMYALNQAIVGINGNTLVRGGACDSNNVTYPYAATAPSTYTCTARPCPAGGPVALPPPGYQPIDLTSFFRPLTNDVPDPALDTSLPANNNNAALVTRIVAACGGAASNYYNAATRELDTSACPNNRTVDVPAGTYNFCRLYQSSRLTMRAQTAAGAGQVTRANRIQMLIDSPYRANSGCLGGDPNPNRRPFNTVDGATDAWGRYTGGSANWVNCPGNASSCPDGSISFQNSPQNGTNDPYTWRIYVWGNGGTCVAGLDCTSDNEPPENEINFNNNADFAVGVVAPWSNVIIVNSGNAASVNCPDVAGEPPRDMCGALFARDIDIKNGFVFKEDTSFRDDFIRVVNPTYYRAAWKQCSTVQAVPSDPRSGC